MMTTKISRKDEEDGENESIFSKKIVEHAVLNGTERMKKV